MYSQELNKRIIDLLAPDGYTDRTESEACYQPRKLAERAIVTRSAPSPTGFVHIGTIYMSLVNKLLAMQSKGVNMLRIEDTDKKREVEGGVKEIVSVLKNFDLTAQEGVDHTGKSYGEYGPYMQSQRAKIYWGYAADLLNNGRAYVCFATKEELDTSYKQQQQAKVRPGYYDQWALWRNKSEEDVLTALDARKPFVLRFKSEGSHDKRVTIPDVLKGNVELPENDLDVPLIKSDEYRLPTYHLAHVVDDFLMQTSVILRGDEWLPSTPLHIELCKALGIKPFRYAHFAPINIMDGTSKRKLSKRKDPQADAKFFLADGYPTEAVLEYLVGLANSNFEDWRQTNLSKTIWDFPFSFEKWSKARGALLDLNKLDDVSKNYIAGLDQEKFESMLMSWAEKNASLFFDVLSKNQEYAHKVLSIERTGNQVRKDMAKWSQAPDQYGYFFDELFFDKESENTIAELLKDLEPSAINIAVKSFLSKFDIADNQESWFEKFKEAASSSGFAADSKAYKLDPTQYTGNLADFARIIRVKLTARNRTPDLYTFIQVMGSERVKSRLQKLN